MLLSCFCLSIFIFGRVCNWIIMNKRMSEEKICSQHTWRRSLTSEFNHSYFPYSYKISFFVDDVQMISKWRNNAIEYGIGRALFHRCFTFRFLFFFFPLWGKICALIISFNWIREWCHSVRVDKVRLQWNLIANKMRHVYSFIRSLFYWKVRRTKETEKKRKISNDFVVSKTTRNKKKEKKNNITR